ncbi:MAG: twin-arginine translocase subunit TatC [Syntrophorhabdaceae bacterium]|nr:twin-arginine translocase subunit TatC [Syntrophorhabdaceae bacterium]
MDREKLVKTLNGLKRVIIKSLIVVAIFSTVCFIFYKDILNLLLKTVKIKVYYFTFPEVFFSSVELALYAGLFFALPFFIILLWDEFKGMTSLKPVEGWLFVIFSILLFYGGSLFCYAVVLRSGITFLLSYEGNVLKAMISVEKFIKFSAAMIFAFGITFEVPIVLLALNKKGIVKAQTLIKTRRYAILFITIASALITPTPDVYNMMLLALPTYILYEIGIILMRLNERKKFHVE